MDRFNLEIERALLGNCIISKDSFIKALDRGITTKEFYNSSNQKVFDSLKESYSLKNSTDILIVSKFAVKKGITVSYLTQLVSESVELSDISAYISELFNLRITRERLELAKDIESGSITTDEEIKKRFDYIDSIKSKIGDDNTITTLDKVEIVDIYTMEKIPTGFKNIDNKLLGFATGTLTIITGYNGNGKSTLINQMCIAESLSHGYKVFAYSPELTNSNLKSWLYPTIANDEHFISKNYNGIEYKALGKIGVNYIDNWIKDKLFIYTDDSIATDENRLLSDMNRLAKQGVKVFIIDNLMKIDLENSYKNEYMAQKIFVNHLKNFARKYGAIVYLVAHPRKPEKGSNKISKFDIAGTGDITNLADYVISISRITDNDREKAPELIGKDSVIKVLKDRIRGNGEFASTFNFDKNRRRFYSSQNELNRDYGYTNGCEIVQVEMNSNKF